MSIASKMGAGALALSMMSGNLAVAGSCASPAEMTALRVAALRQQLMVAALSCHRADSFNQFVISNRVALDDSDHALMGFFVRQSAQNGADGYNAYKTRLANDSSLRSLNDPQFCSSAEFAFDLALNRNLSLAELVSQQALPIETGFAGCRANAPTMVADITPRVPARHEDMVDNAPAESAANAPNAYDNAQGGPQGGYRDAYDAAPDAYAPNRYMEAGPLTQVQGPDGRWYLQSTEAR